MKQRRIVSNFFIVFKVLKFIFLISFSYEEPFSVQVCNEMFLKELLLRVEILK